MTDPRIEAAARAICNEIFCMDWNNADVSRKDECMQAARIALAATDAVVAGTSPQTITIPEVRNDRPIPVKGGVDG